MEFNMVSALVITIEGLLIVFSVLLIIMLVLYAMKLVAKKDAPEAISQTVPATEKSVRPIAISDVDVDAMDENEKIAILSAALAAYMDQPISGISISSYRKISE